MALRRPLSGTIVNDYSASGLPIRYNPISY